MTLRHPRMKRGLLGARSWTTLACTSLSAWLVCGAGCSGGGAKPGGSGGAGATGGQGGGGDAIVFRPCSGETNVGAFEVSLVEAAGTTPAFAQLGGRIRDGVNLRSVWRADTTDGDCRFMVPPALTCSPACVSPQLCFGANKCATEPVSRSAGSIDVTGLTVPVTGLMPLGNMLYNKDLSDGAYPPAAPGALVTFRASGGDYAAFNLAARGVEPLTFAGTGITVNRDMPLAIAWTPPTGAPSGKVMAKLDIAYHGGGSSRIECTWDDDGSAQIGSALINKLLDAGTAGFPTIALTRRSVDSTTLTPPGCVEFAVSAFVERQVMVCPQPGMCVISCGPEMPCPAGQTCGNNKKCGP